MDPETEERVGPMK